MRNRRTIRKAMGWLLTAALLVGGHPLGVSVRAENGEWATSQSEEKQGKNHTYSFDEADVTFCLYDDGTAEITKIVNSGGTHFDIPGEVDYEGTTYIVDEMRLSNGSKGDFTSVTFPKSLKMIGGYLNSFKNVQVLTIPGTVKEFRGAIQDSTALQTLIFEEGVEVIEADSMVYGCKNLKTVVLPDSLKKLAGSWTLGDAAALKNVKLPAGVEISGNGLFGNCKALKTMDLPASVTTVNTSMFKESGLETLTAQGTLTKIGETAFYKCTSLKAIPDLSGVTEIGWRAFYGCTSLSEVIVLDSLKSIGVEAFSDCYSLQGEPDLSKLTEIPKGAFYGTSISAVKFGDDLQSIDENAFGYTTLKSITLPNSLKTIGTSAFAGSWIAGELVIPNSVTELGENAFMRTKISSLWIGSGLETIPSGAFKACGKLKTVTIDNRPSNVTIAADAFPSSTTVNFTKYDEDWDDTISAETAVTLQQAVDAAPDNEETTIDVSKNIGLSDVVTVPGGKKIVLNFAPQTEGESLTVRAETMQKLTGFFKIEEGAALTVSGAVTLNGKQLAPTGTMLDCAGTLTVGQGVTITNATVDKADNGVVRVSGKNARLVMEGGTLTKSKIQKTDSAPVYVGDGAEFTMNGGSITDNTAQSATNNRESAGVFVTNGGRFIMNDGSIADNSGCRGTAVQVNSSGERAYFTMTGGEISGNVSTGSRSDLKKKASGAVHIDSNAEFRMSGGTITNNRAATGGGVCVVDWGLQNIGPEYQTTFVMDGGTISGNTATDSGGGIYSYSNYVYLNAGEISGNKAEQGGGVYSEGNSNYYSTLHMEKVLITGNEAEQGGGMWFCPTGDGKIYVTDGTVLFGNSATGCGDDFVSAAREGHTVTLAGRMLNGGAVGWYLDGSVVVPLGSNLQTTVGALGRYGTLTGTQAEPRTVENYTGGIALKAVTGEASAVQAAGQATLKIVKNEAVRGGGVGANGGVVIGKNQTTETEVKKLWSGGTDRPAVTVELLNDGVVIDSVELTGEEGWSHRFEGLPEGGTYSVREKSVENYTGTVTGNSESGFVITNTYTPPPPTPSETPEPPDDDPEDGGLTVTKTVTGNAGEKGRAFTFTVTLSNTGITGQRGEMRFINGVAVFGLKDGEQKTTSGLPSGVKYTVTEREADSEGYATTVSGETGTIKSGKTAVVKFVNEKTTSQPEVTPTPTPSETPTLPPTEPPVSPPPESPEIPEITPEPPETTPDVPEQLPEITPTVPEMPPEPVPVLDDTPKTGDAVAVWLTLWCLSLMGGAVLLLRRGKKKHE